MSETEKDETSDVKSETESETEKSEAAVTAEEMTAEQAGEEETAAEKAESIDDRVTKPVSTAAEEELISQDEMDTLLKGVSEGDLSVETMSFQEPGTAVKYDFAHPAHKLNAKLPVMPVINDRIAKALGPEMSALLRQRVEVVIEDFSAYKFQEYTHSLPASVSINRVRFHPLPASSLVSLDGNLVFSLVDSFFGGTGQRSNKELVRNFTPTEQRIIERTLTATLKTISDAWRPTFPIEPEYVRSELSTEITSPANPSEVLLVSKFKVELEHGGGELHVAIPYASIEPARPALTASLDKPSEDNNLWAQQFTEMVIDAPIELQGIIAETELTLGELVNLREGDFIPLGKGNIAQFFSEQIPLFEATIGAANGMISAQLIDSDNTYQQ